MSEWFVGVDLGGTNIRVAIGDGKRGILGRASEATDKRDEPKSLVNQIVRMINSIQCRDFNPKKIRGIGIGSAGPLDLYKGGLMNPTNLPWKHVPLVEPIQEKFDVPIYLLNDCTAAVVGEKEFGGGKGFSDIVYVTISTGIGGGVYVDGHLLIGKDGNAHEIGHMTIDLEGRLQCGCGKRGHWEAYCSGLNIPNYVQLLLEEKNGKTFGEISMKETGNNFKKITAKILYDSAKAGDELAKEFVDRIGELNAVGFANIINVYDPEIIIVGGAVTLMNRDLIMNPIRKGIKNYTVNRLPKIKVSMLKDDAVLYGTIAYVCQNFQRA